MEKIESLIEVARFCSSERKNFLFEDEKTISYYCCKKTNVSNCSKTCNNCREIFARYVVVDLRDKNNEDVCSEKIFKSDEHFRAFQESYLSEMFFYERTEVRFNIYLIFVCRDTTQIGKYSDYALDINFARKLFLSEKGFEEYFGYYKMITKDTDNDFDKNNIYEINKIVRKLNSNGIKSILIENGSDKIIDYFLNSNINKTTYDQFCGIKDNEATFIKKHIYKQTTDIDTPEIKTVGFVKKMKVENFREICFGEHKTFEFGNANIIYGINTGGKTSILDAIEYGFIGEMHKNTIEDINKVCVEIQDKNGIKTTSTESLEKALLLKNKWYPNKMGELKDLFGRINYFDTDAAYRFALEQGDREKAYDHIKLLLSSYELYSIQNIIKNNLKHALSFKFIFEHDEFIYRKFSKQPQTKKNKNLIDRLFSTNKEKNTIYEVNKNKNRLISNFLTLYIESCNNTLKIINGLINMQIEDSLKIINIIFRKLHSQNYKIVWQNEVFHMQNIMTEETISFEEMSTAQKACFALAVIFTQFIQNDTAPRIILLDESVANFDVFHLLNLFDFLRDFVLNDVQIFFTTASDNVAEVAKSKLSFLGNDCYIYKIVRNPGEPSQVIKERL